MKNIASFVIFCFLVVGAAGFAAQGINGGRLSKQQVRDQIAYTEAAIRFEQMRLDLIHEQAASTKRDGSKPGPCAAGQLQDAEQLLAADNLALASMKYVYALTPAEAK